MRLEGTTGVRVILTLLPLLLLVAANVFASEMVESLLVPATAAIDVEQNFLDLSNPHTIWHHHLPVTASVGISVFGAFGWKICTLVNAFRPSNVHILGCNGSNQSGQEVSSGFYLCRIKAVDYIESKKMLLLK